MATLEVRFNRVYFKYGLTVPDVRFTVVLSHPGGLPITLTDNTDHQLVRQQGKTQLELYDSNHAAWSRELQFPDNVPISVHFTPTATNPTGWGTMGGIPLALTQLQDWGIDVVQPRRTRRFLTETDQYVLDWEILKKVAPGGAEIPNKADVLRQTPQGRGLASISGGGGVVPCVEFQPIVPMPETGGWKGPFLYKCKRWADRLIRNSKHNLGYPIKVTDTSSWNVFPNPAAIPVLNSDDADPSRRPHNETCARIEFTRYTPKSMTFGDDDPRLQWDYVSLDGQGAIEFFGDDDKKDRGLKVKVYGTHKGEVELRVRYCPGNGGGEHDVGWYRALVRPIRNISCRVNILEGPNRSDKPRCTISDIRAHLRIADRFLRQMAVELQLDQDDTIGPVHAPVIQADISPVAGHDGYFRIKVPRGWTRNVDALGNSPPCMTLNYRNNVINILYVKNIKPILKTTIAILTLGMRRKGGIGKEDTCGQAVSWPASGAGEFILDSPPSGSMSWGLPYGRGYGARPEVQKMKLSGNSPAPGSPNCFALFLSDKMGNPTKTGGIGPMGRGGRYRYGVTLAHEVSHIMNLEHRRDLGDGEEDGLQYPRLENVMYYMAWSMCQDFDIIQTKAVHQSPLGHY